jgi:transcriptional regulator with AAA-type ATPase domain
MLMKTGPLATAEPSSLPENFDPEEVLLSTINRDYRVFPIELPPLRERPENIRLLVQHFAADYAARMRKANYRHFRRHRAFRNCLQRSCAKCSLSEPAYASKTSAPITPEQADRSHNPSDSSPNGRRSRRSERRCRPAGFEADDVNLHDEAVGN